MMKYLNYYLIESLYLTRICHILKAYAAVVPLLIFLAI